MQYTMRRLGAIGGAVAILLVVVLSVDSNIPPVAAQGPHKSLMGQPVSAARTGVFNYAQFSANAVNSPRQTLTRRVIPSPKIPGKRQSGTVTLVPLVNGAARAPLRVLSPSPSPASSFAGLDDDNTIIPPDTTGPVGPTALMETLNNNIRIQNRSGGITATIGLFDFWNVAPSVLPSGTTINNGPFDPSVIYDPFAGRFIHVVASNDISILTAVDPTL